jgi:hypothetical protein
VASAGRHWLPRRRCRAALPPPSILWIVVSMLSAHRAPQCTPQRGHEPESALKTFAVRQTIIAPAGILLDRSVSRRHARPQAGPHGHQSAGAISR